VTNPDTCGAVFDSLSTPTRASSLNPVTIMTADAGNVKIFFVASFKKKPFSFEKS
jgi:hypothetical protein